MVNIRSRYEYKFNWGIFLFNRRAIDINYERLSDNSFPVKQKKIPIERLFNTISDEIFNNPGISLKKLSKKYSKILSPKQMKIVVQRMIEDGNVRKETFGEDEYFFPMFGIV